jgi:hypothetical protein
MNPDACGSLTIALSDPQVCARDEIRPNARRVDAKPAACRPYLLVSARAQHGVVCRGQIC